ncbi:MAG: hypothetical protein HC914_01655 [Chloroflexaceae bacterium]|nr:hypothetical protein [Chloroflexaceae bacterium]
MQSITNLLGAKRWGLLLGIGAVGILALVGWRIGAASAPPSAVAQGKNSTSVISTPTSIDPFAIEQMLMATAAAALADPTLSEHGRRIYTDELQTLREQTTSVALARTRVAATKTAQPGTPVALNVTPGPISTMGPLPSGILRRFNPPLPGQTAIFTNAWRNEVDGVWVSTYAGAYTQNGDQGFIYVLRWQSWEGGILTDPLPGGLFDAPVQGGALTITAYTAGVLTLETQDGQTLFFDVRSLAFIPEQQ